MSVISFLRQNSGIIVKMLVNQLGMTVFGLLLAMATASNSTLLLLTSLFSVIFYMSLLYTMTWEFGAKDKIRIDGGRLAYTPYKGMLVSVAANTPNIILAVLANIGFFCIADFTEFTPVWAANLYGVCDSVARFIQGMFLGFLRVVIPENAFGSQYPFGLFITVIPPIFASGFGYFMGLKEKRLFGSLIPQKNAADAIGTKPKLK